MDAKRTKHEGGVSLPDDIAFDVLARLPAKTLCRFRCVCKGWRALISDPAFIAARRSRAADPHLVGVFSGSRHPDLAEVRVIDMDSNVVRAFEITRRTPLPPQLPKGPDLICADGSRLPYDGGMIIDLAAERAFTAFGMTDPTPLSGTCTYSTTLGRATPSGAFKVLHLQIPFKRDDDQLCEVATIMDAGGGTGPLTWRRKSAPPLVITDWSCEHKAIVNGVIYFLHELDVDEDDDAAPSLNPIVAFDLESEEWKAEAIRGPALLGHLKYGGVWYITLVEFNGTLAFIHDVRVNHYRYLSIWLLVDPNKSVWVKEHTIPMIPISKNNQIVTTKPLGVLMDGRILLWSRVFDNEDSDEETWLYDSLSSSSRSCTVLRPKHKGFYSDGRGILSDISFTVGATYLQHK